MTSKINCPLCGNEAVQMRDRSEVYLINCPSCGDFQITRECLEDLPAERKLQAQLMKVSAFTRYRTINKEPVATLFISNPNGYTEGYTIQQIVDQFPSVPERKLKALQNLQGLSKYWGDAVALERKDYSIFFPEVNEEQPSLMMMRTLVEEGLATGEVKFPTQLTVTEKGNTFIRDQAAPAAPEAPTPATQAPVIEEPTPVAAQPSKLDGLHPRVLGVAQKLFQDGHYRSAVLDTYVALDNDVRRKSRLQHDGTELMQKAFTINNKKGTNERATILKVAGGDDPQQGAMWLFSGAVMGVRNVLAHDHSIHPSEQEALEQLYFASMLFRRLDQAVNIEAEQLMAEISQLRFSLTGSASSSDSAKLKAFLVPSSGFVDAELHRVCFRKILEIIKSGYFNDQNEGINLLLEWNASIFDHITYEDHVELICAIYKAAGFRLASRDAETLIRERFVPIKTSLKLFQERLLSSNEVFNELLEKIWWNDAFFRLIAHSGDLEFMVAFLNKVISKEIVLSRNDLDTLSRELNRAGREGLEELTELLYQMNEELNK
ncbi:TIGR02391 family protein [Paenibacillus dokdonensis]|uniref:TIGR02391 family protein n=1 Tax=Paenibacillus dokdonensis TaxID=2567944 RepID=A0ABU6GWM7_9BACL|nr:TIGR02391 family protein [Paenibacillus dokdonensis]MEC0244160.1 TIGR02391 family protein [Paenibacillus dokdonensis]